MGNNRNRDDVLLEHVNQIAVSIGFLVAIAWCIYWLGFNPNTKHIQAARDWQPTPALVSQVSDVKGDSAATAFRMATLKYSDFYGVQRTIELPLNFQISVGDIEKILVGKKGGVYVENRLDIYEDNPLNASDSDHWFMVALIMPVIVGFLAWGASWILMVAILSIFFWVLRLLTTPLLFRLIGRTSKRVYLRCRDEVKLRVEFFKRRKRIRPSPAYKLVRRFQAELARMDPTPSVIGARRRANELMTSILERDNQRVEVIDGMINEIRGDIDMDLEAREQAHAELAQQS